MVAVTFNPQSSDDYRIEASCFGLVRRKRKQLPGVDYFPFPWNPHLSTVFRRKGFGVFFVPNAALASHFSVLRFLHFFYRNPPFQTQPKSILSLHEWQKTFFSFACVQYRYGYLHFSPVVYFDYAFLIFLVIWFSQYHTVWCQIITWSLFAKNKLGHRQRL